MDGSQMQGSLQLHSAAQRPTAPDDLQRMLRQNGPQREITVREREEDLYLAATNKLIHGGPRVHDGKYRHWSHVLL